MQKQILSHMLAGSLQLHVSGAEMFQAEPQLELRANCISWEQEEAVSVKLKGKGQCGNRLIAEDCWDFTIPFSVLCLVQVVGGKHWKQKQGPLVMN